MSKRILVVEDQEDNRQIIRDMLTFTDYEIVEAESGDEATGHGRLRGDAPDQGRSGNALDPDHCGHLLCA